MNKNLLYSQGSLVIVAILGCLLFLTSCGDVAEERTELTCTLNDKMLVETKKAVENGDPIALSILDSLIKQSEAWLEMPLLSVVNKSKVPPSGDKHDYVTLSPYWWPNPDTGTGLPYVRRDGERNPEVYDYPERENSLILGRIVESLGVLYFITEDEKYAKKAAELIKEWFLNPDTRMNPNMVYSQIRPGIEQIRGTGIIDARRLIGAFNGARLISGSHFWTPDDEKQLKDWAFVFAYWLENSLQGRMEKASSNNHGVWYDVILLTMHYYADNKSRAIELLNEMTWNRLFAQQAEDGSFPRELERTIALHYSTFVFEAFVVAAEIGKKLDFDLWSKKSETGLTMKTAIDFLLPYYLKAEEWPYPQINPFDYNEGALMLYRAGLALNDDIYMNAARSIGYELKPDVASLLYFTLNR